MRSSAKMVTPREDRCALRVTAIYLAFGLLWILLSDHAARLLAPTPAALDIIQLLKGWAYVLTTALIIYTLIHRHEIRLSDALRESTLSRERYERLFTAAHSAVVVLNDRYEVLHWNSPAAAMLGWRGQGASHRALPDLILAPGDTSQRGTLLDLLSGRTTERVETRVRTPSGDERNIIWNAYRIDAVAGAGCEIVLVGRDATEVRRLEARIQAVEKLEAVGLLSAGVAHDFNNVLTVVIGNLDVAREALNGPHPDVHTARESLELIENAARRATVLTRQLLSLGRKQPTAGHPAETRIVLYELRDMLSRLLPESIRVEIDAPQSLWGVALDAGQLEQVLLNLAVNARDAMPSGGVLHITAANQELPEPRVVITVRDTGSGMSPETLTHIFEPFFTTKPMGKGTGIGLTSVKRAIEGAGGEVRVESASGVGTTFRVILPASRSEAATAERAASVSVEIGDERLLVCEDDHQVRNLLAQVLREYGYHVTAASTPREALHLVETAETPFDLLISDVAMPGMSGPELVQRLDERGLGMGRVLFISGHVTDPDDEVAGWSTAWLSKPFAPRELLANIRIVLDRAPQDQAARR